MPPGRPRSVAATPPALPPSLLSSPPPLALFVITVVVEPGAAVATLASLPLLPPSSAATRVVGSYTRVGVGVPSAGGDVAATFATAVVPFGVVATAVVVGGGVVQGIWFSVSNRGKA